MKAEFTWKIAAPSLLLLACVFALYGRTIGFEALSWDDKENLFANPSMQGESWLSWAGLWWQPYFGLYIPLTYTVWGLWFKVASLLAPQHVANSLHFLNVCMHALNAVLFLRLIRKYGVGRNLAIFAALLFICHPIQAATVSWISGFRDLFGASLGLTALLLAHDAVTKRRKAAAIGMFILCILAKPSLASLPIVVVIMNPRAWRLALGALAATAPILLVSQFQQVDSAFDWLGPIWFRLPVAMDTLVFYVYKILAPISFGPDYGRSPEYLYISGMWGWTALIAVAILAMVAYLRSPALWRAILVFGAILGPVLGLTPFLHQNFSTPSDHYAYLSLLAIGVLMLPINHRKADNPLRINIRYMSAAMLVLTGLSVITWRETAYWSNNTTLYRHMADINPHSFNAHINLAAELLKLDPKSQEAERSLDTAMSLQPGHTLPLFYLSRLYLHREQPDKVMALLEPWVELGPKKKNRFAPESNYNRVLWGWIELNHAIAAKRLGRLADCDSYLLKALDYDADNASIYYQIGLRLITKGRLLEALSAMRQAAELDPGTAVYAESVASLQKSF